MRIECNSCVLRPWQESDIPFLPSILNNHKITDRLRDGIPHPYTEKDAKEWIELNLLKKPAENLTIEIHEKPAGSVGINLQENVHRVSAEIGYYLNELYWGKGIMTEAVNAMTRYVFDTFDINRIFAAVFSNNPASMKVLEKAGYVLEGIQRQSIIKNEVVRDEHVYSILRSECNE